MKLFFLLFLSEISSDEIRRYGRPLGGCGKSDIYTEWEHYEMKCVKECDGMVGRGRIKNTGGHVVA